MTPPELALCHLPQVLNKAISDMCEQNSNQTHQRDLPQARPPKPLPPKR